MKDLDGNEVVVGSVLRGFGLHNAGIHLTVLKLGRKEHMKHLVLVEGHLTKRRAWHGVRWYRVVQPERKQA